MFVQASTDPIDTKADSPTRLAGKLTAAQHFFRDCQPAAVVHAVARLAERTIGLECDDPTIFSDFFAMFGGSAPSPGPLAVEADLEVQVVVEAHADHGWFRIGGYDPMDVDGREFSFALASDRGIFRQLPEMPDGWSCFAFRDSGILAFAFRERECIFSKHPSWRESIMWYLFWRLLRIRSDTIFFHASTVGIAGQGIMFVGAAGAGKSTTALALAARGHDFLGDEVAAYLPASGSLTPFRRPVGIKRGPRCGAVEQALGQDNRSRIQGKGFARIAISDLFDVPAPRDLPLRHVVFLDGFAAQPRIDAIRPGPSDVARLQPLLSSFLNESHSRRIFQLTRLLGSTRCHRLAPGDPDVTADFLQDHFSS
jgi:hypothetical protein